MYKLQNAEQINRAIGQIPIACEKPVFVGKYPYQKGQTIYSRFEPKFKAILVENGVVAITSDHYKLVQHKDAFRPIIEGLTLRGVDEFKFALFSNHKRAWLNIFIGKGYDSVQYGFRVTNSVDGTTSIRYGLSAFNQTKILELVGYRQVCDNGMIVRVNLENAEFVREEEKVKIQDLLSMKIAFKHQGDVEGKMERVQHITEAFLLLEKPLERIIKKAQSITLVREKAEEFIKKYIGQRKLDKVMELYNSEEQTLWGLYNATTFLYSHKDVIKATKLNTGLQKASIMLEEELKVPL